jgi:hypothetical protein
MAGDFSQHDGKWFVTVATPNSGDTKLGPFETREKAGAAYIAKVNELYPPSPPSYVDPTKHHSLAASGIITGPTKIL